MVGLINGDGRPAVQMDEAAMNQAPVIQVNAGLTRRDIMTVIGFMMTGVSALITGGYLFLPARQTDMMVVQQSISTLEKEVTGLKQSTDRITGTLDRIQDAITVLVERRPQPLPRPKAQLTPPKPTPRPERGG